MNDEIRQRYAAILKVSPESVSADLVIAHLEAQQTQASEEISNLRGRIEAMEKQAKRAAFSGKLDKHIKRGATTPNAVAEMLNQYDAFAGDPAVLEAAFDATLTALPDEAAAPVAPQGTGDDSPHQRQADTGKADVFARAYQARITGDNAMDPAEALRVTTQELGYDHYEAYADSGPTLEESWKD